jgi:hypothetical protein
VDVLSILVSSIVEIGLFGNLVMMFGLDDNSVERDMVCSVEVC